MMGKVAEIAEQFPQGGAVSDLEPAERARLADLLGMSEDKLAAYAPSHEQAVGGGYVASSYEETGGEVGEPLEDG
jgi:hypothetical protein